MLSRERIGWFFKKETVFCVSGLAALLSAIFVHPTAACKEFVDFEVLALLFCLMVVVAAIKDSGAFEVLSRELLKRGRTLRSISMILIVLSLINIANSAKNTLCIKKQNNFFISGWLCYY